MKKMASMLIGLSLAFGGAAFAQSQPDPPKTEKKKVEKAKSKTEKPTSKTTKGKAGEPKAQ